MSWEVVAAATLAVVLGLLVGVLGTAVAGLLALICAPLAGLLRGRGGRPDSSWWWT